MFIAQFPQILLRAAAEEFGAKMTERLIFTPSDARIITDARQRRLSIRPHADGKSRITFAPRLSLAGVGGIQQNRDRDS
jgi:hypothetical protein